MTDSSLQDEDVTNDDDDDGGGWGISDDGFLRAHVLQVHTLDETYKPHDYLSCWREVFRPKSAY